MSRYRDIFFMDPKTYDYSIKLSNYISDIGLTPSKGNMVLNKTPLSQYLKRNFSWVLDLTGVEVYSPVRRSKKTIQLSIVVSPTHYSEISTNFHLENLVKNKLSEKIQRLLIAMYPEIDSDDHILFLFFPEQSNTLFQEL